MDSIRNARVGVETGALNLDSIENAASSSSRKLVEAPKQELEHEARIHTDRKVWDKSRKLDPISGHGTGRII